LANCSAFGIVTASTLLCLVAGEARADSPIAVLFSGQDCPDETVAEPLVAALEQRGRRPVGAARVAAAVARERARRALIEARRLYTRADFSGCIALLSIIEQELGRHLGNPGGEGNQDAHRLLARVNFWLGTCQWAAGDPQTAASSFVRAAQLPGTPHADRRLLPPGLIEAHREAISAPREEVSCDLDPSVRADDLLVNGKGPTVKGQTLRVPVGTHYLLLQARCRGPGRCPPGRSLRLEARPLGCKVPMPGGRSHGLPLACVSPAEASDADFAGAVAGEVGVAEALVTAVSDRNIGLRLAAVGRADYVRQLVNSRTSAQDPSRVVTRAVGLVMDERHTSPGPREVWYRKWWIWALVGTAATAAVVTGVALAAREDHVTVVFER
jgi:hypothetical protein